MNDLICIGFINALFIWGIFCLFDDEYLLDGVGKLIERTIGTFWSMPLFRCQSCMSSLWGMAFFFSVKGFLWIVIPYCICLCGLNYILVKIVYK